LQSALSALEQEYQKKLQAKDQDINRLQEQLLRVFKLPDQNLPPTDSLPAQNTGA
jgi:hypothetical protein